MEPDFFNFFMPQLLRQLTAVTFTISTTLPERVPTYNISLGGTTRATFIHNAQLRLEGDNRGTAATAAAGNRSHSLVTRLTPTAPVTGTSPLGEVIPLSEGREERAQQQLSSGEVSLRRDAQPDAASCRSEPAPTQSLPSGEVIPPGGERQEPPPTPMMPPMTPGAGFSASGVALAADVSARQPTRAAFAMTPIGSVYLPPPFSLSLQPCSSQYSQSAIMQQPACQQHILVMTNAAGDAISMPCGRVPLKTSEYTLQPPVIHHYHATRPPDAASSRPQAPPTPPEPTGKPRLLDCGDDAAVGEMTPTC